MIPVDKDREQMVKEAAQGTNIFRGLATLQSMPVADALGACCAFLLHCAYEDDKRQMFRRVMREPVHKDGFVGISLLEVFRRQSQ
jgi:hypothetical protein